MSTLSESGADELELEQPSRVKRRRGGGGKHSKTISPTGLTREEMRRGIADICLDDQREDFDRPRTRGDCLKEERPCPWVSCKHHLYLDVNPETGSITQNFPSIGPEEMKVSCVLDVADAGTVNLQEIGVLLNMTREGVRRIKVRVLAHLQGTPSASDLFNQLHELEDFESSCEPGLTVALGQGKAKK